MNTLKCPNACSLDYYIDIFRQIISSITVDESMISESHIIPFVKLSWSLEYNLIKKI